MKSKLYENIINKYNNDELGHAFLIETRNRKNTQTELKKIMKKILCKNKYKENCRECRVCHLIDSNNYINFVEISPINNIIKKDQIKDLINHFSYKISEEEKGFYIINEAEKINNSAANALLKFLEEPPLDVIGFLITNNRESVIKTINSRCQFIKISSSLETNGYNISVEELQSIKESIYDYLNTINSEKKPVLLYNRDMQNSKYLTKGKVLIYFEIMEDLMYDMYLQAMNVVPNNNNILKEIKNIEVNIEKKLQVISKIKNMCNYNINLKLLLDYFVIEMGKYNE